MRLSRLAGGVVVVLVGALSAAPAQAATVEQVCAGTEVTTFDPPLTFTPRETTITVSGVFPSCTNAGAVTGTYAETFSLTASCLTLFDSGAAQRTFAWGGTVAPTEFQYNAVSNAAGAAVVTTNTGVVTSGGFAPAGAVQVVSLVTPNALQCLTAGVVSMAGPTTLTIQRS
ncbi:hypothetical protein LZG04_41100 [Saccharothrix sp. S26]|uniref:hypothetical protein n=1 Tax=Saccharothrix sp. S26 TaxID=2907215 RepID=UPI001F18B973|nr:hypothetical protein [Saccharothrix sp. S26]MCE7001174.1 hypothetical protein [Saccharothrix sp. S26]